MFVTYFNATLFNVPFHEIKCRVVVVIFIYNIHTHTHTRAHFVKFHKKFFGGRHPSTILYIKVGPVFYFFLWFIQLYNFCSDRFLMSTSKLYCVLLFISLLLSGLFFCLFVKQCVSCGHKFNCELHRFEIFRALF